MNQQESSLIQNALGNQQIISTAIVRLYKAAGNVWEYTKIMGAVALTGDKNILSFNVVNLNSKKIVFTQQLYNNFQYETVKPFFHVFEIDDCVAGFSFADEKEATQFAKNVQQAKGGRVTPQARGPPPAAAKHKPGPPSPAPVTPVSGGTPPPASSAAAKKADKKQKKQSRWKLWKKDEDEDFEVSDPRGFRHESHIGWDPSAGFEIRNIPPEWRKLFQAAGVKKSELRDAETAKFVMDVIGEAVGSEMANGAAPAAPPKSGGAPKPRVPPSVPKATGTPPAPPKSGGPPPPPAPTGGPPPPSGGPPPPSGGPPPPAAPKSNNAPPPVSGGRGDLLSSIQKGTSLKHVDKDDSGLPDLSAMDNEGSKSLADTLAAAMSARRVDIEEEDSDEDSEWSD